MKLQFKFLLITLFALGFTMFVNVVDAHQSGCHRWHSCPSDTGSYVCGDLGYPCQYPTYSTNNSYSSPSYSYYTPSYSSYTSCPANSYKSGSSCRCNFGYVVDGGKCISGSSYCMDQIGLMSQFDSLTNTCECMSGYAIGVSGLCTYQSKYSGYYYGGSYDLDELNSCPAHSTQSVDDSDSCTCDIGYQPNAKKTKCVKISKKTNDKLCRADFGKNSQWDGDYDYSDGAPYCECKKGYEWNTKQTSCIKES